MTNQIDGRLPHVVIVGGGFAGLQVARRLKRAPVRVTLIDRHNYHLFQPLLYQVATGGLSPANIATSLRAILGRNKNCEILLAEVTDLDAQRKTLILRDGTVSYDDLVVAVGASHSYFGNEKWQKYAPGLKSIREATDIRRRIFLAFEAAEREDDPDVRKEFMTFVIVGGGPTGVELAGALSEISRHTLKHDFRRINPQDANIILVETSQHVLNSYPPHLCERAASKMGDLKIDLRLQQEVVEITDRHVTLFPVPSPTASNAKADVNSACSTTIRTRTVLWAAGIKGNSLGAKVAKSCHVEMQRSGRVPVTPQLHIATDPHVFVIGDLAHCLDKNGEPLPCLAPVAIQQGRYVAKLIKRRASGISRGRPEANGSPKPFKYRDYGSMATIGRAAAIAKIGKIELSGFTAWLMWLVVHLMQLVQFQNRALVLIQWGWNYITFNRSARIITGEDEPGPEGLPGDAIGKS